MAHRPGISMDRLMGAAAVACASCRRLKVADMYALVNENHLAKYYTDEMYWC